VNDLVVYQPRPSIDLAPDAWRLAERISATDFVPVAFRGKPEAVLAAILTGNELGIDAMQSLAKIHVIEGKPAISAELMRALVLRAGHELWVEESTNTKCTVAGRRHGTEQTSRITWTMDDARRAGLEQRQNWRRYPKQMLVARATSELARLAFPDVLAGVSYSVEELTDGEIVDIGDVTASVSSIGAETAPKKNPRRAARAVAAPTAAQAPAAPTDVPVLPPLPGEHGYVGEWDQIQVVEVAPTTSTGGEPSSMPEAGSPPPSTGGEPTAATALATSGDATQDPSIGPDDAGDAASPPVSKAAQARAQRAAIACGEVGIQTDDERHRFLAAVTEGRTSSGKGLTTADLELVLEMAERFGRGEIRLVEEDGHPALRASA